MGELPLNMPVPRGSVLCGYENNRRATYCINDTADENALAQFFRDALAAQGFDLQTDNPQTSGGKFLVFGRGASETIQIETTLSDGAKFRNAFSIAYVAPTDARGNPLTDTTIMRSAKSDSNRTASADAPNASSGNNQNSISGLCGSAYNPIGANIERKHRITANGLPSREMTETYRDIAAASFVVHSDFAGANDSAVKSDIK